MNTCHLVALFVAVAASTAEITVWPGPFADHILGQPVEDTPEVAAAKRQHAEAHSQVRAILPELPLEERFPNVHAPVIAPQHPVVIPQHVQQPVVVTVKPQFTHFVEEVPRSSAEVDAARALAKVVAEAKDLLQKLNSAELPAVAPPVQPAVVGSNYVPVDTPEVAAAKLEHARAVAAALRLAQ
ncbi:hypothetical protein BDFB_006699 [Asbolus verrucosus]|uniref:Uncharacterized protein n=1 Tax=Asbolus verrucosus TaxID=1661398 RepID=A0A482V6D7_ASBVE|nr:hypothetical protein BDFB_006699 [Asbolus verrucosus]